MFDFNNMKDAALSGLGKAADATRDVAGKAVDSGKELAGKVADKARAGARITKLSVDIAREKDNIKKAYQEIGKLYYDSYKNEPGGFFAQLCGEIDLSMKAIEEKEAEIADLKAGKKEEEEDITVEFEAVVEAAEAEAAAPAETATVEEPEATAEAVEAPVAAEETPSEEPAAPTEEPEA